jgi:hypothetical protein
LSIEWPVSGIEFSVQQFGNFFCSAWSLDHVQGANDELIEPFARIFGRTPHSGTSCARSAVIGFYKQTVPIGWCKQFSARRIGNFIHNYPEIWDRFRSPENIKNISDAG